MALFQRVFRPVPLSHALVFVAVAGAAGAQGRDAQQPAARPTEPFRKEHVEVKVHLGHADEWVRSLMDGTAADPKGTMGKVVAFFRGHIVPHAEWEERVLYPAVDKRAAKGANPFTASMRHEHRIVGKWIDALAAEAGKDKPDPKAFARDAFKLLGLVEAHFEVEEEVLLPVLDKSMTAKQFEKEIGHGH